MLTEVFPFTSAGFVQPPGPSPSVAMYETRFASVWAHCTRSSLAVEHPRPASGLFCSLNSITRLSERRTFFSIRPFASKASAISMTPSLTLCKWYRGTDTDAAITLNSGGYHTSVKAGDITPGQVLAMTPFGNSIIDLTLIGGD